MSRLSLVMIVRDEEKRLGRCLSSVQELVDEIVVVDTGSRDQTVSIARAYGASVYHFEWTDDFSEARNFALSKSTSDWNLVLDADNYVTHAETSALKAFLEQDSKRWIGRIKIIDEAYSQGEYKETVGWYSRLFPSELRYAGRIHEEIVSDYPRQRLPIIVRHDGYVARDKSSRNIPLLLSALKDSPSPYYHFQLGKEYYGIKDYVRSCEQFHLSYSQLTGRESFAPQVVVNYLYALLGLGNLSLGMKIILESHEYAKGYSDYYFVCGLFYLDYIMEAPQERLHLLPRIEECYLLALEAGEGDHREHVKGTGSDAALFNLGVFYETTGRIKEAKEAYFQAGELGNSKAKERLNLLTK
ncbi:glycosyltransferase family 2 protein [Paenibacillus sp. FSL W8-1187]|uniref:glycosyltransferase family 2 protein n=1 Tax=Paenibacillus sp. FSL W8-1187 TaxID=2975339 RepID=UPI0030D79613